MLCLHIFSNEHSEKETKIISLIRFKHTKKKKNPYSSTKRYNPIKYQAKDQSDISIDDI